MSEAEELRKVQAACLGVARYLGNEGAACAHVMKWLTSAGQQHWRFNCSVNIDGEVLDVVVKRRPVDGV